MAAEDDALAAVEDRVRRRIRRDLAGLASKTLVVLRRAIAQAPDATVGELLSRADVHQAITAHLQTARTATETAVRAGHRGAVHLGHTHARNQLRQLGFHSTGKVRSGSAYLPSVLADVATAYNQALAGIQDSVRTALEGVGGSDPQAARTLVLHAALRRAVARLYTRVGAAGAAATHRGFSDAHAAEWAAYAAAQHTIRLVKTWQVRSTNPCPMCLALDGTTVNADAQFDATAGSGHRVVGVYTDLSVPPRHPYCRCRVIYHRADVGADAVPFR